MFGPPTWRRPLRTGDHVLALTDHSETDSVIVSRVLSTRHALHAFTHTHDTHTHTHTEQGVCMPGEICGRKHKKLRVEFCDGKK